MGTTDVLTIAQARDSGVMDKLMCSIKILDHAGELGRTSDSLTRIDLLWIYQVVELTQEELVTKFMIGGYQKSLAEIYANGVRARLIEKIGLDLGRSLSYELKCALKIVPRTGDLRECYPTGRLPTMEQLLEQRRRLDWLIEHYEQVMAGLEAANE